VKDRVGGRRGRRDGKAIMKKGGKEINIRKTILSVIIIYLGTMAIWCPESAERLRVF
jgi:hypothetical protein